MKYKHICPECDGNEIYMKAVDSIGGYGPNLLPGLGKLFSDNPYFELFICGKCGYIQFYVPNKFLSAVKEHYEPAK
jgi:predicted nucleic-acid-binding Zn-ribbon protein